MHGQCPVSPTTCSGCASLGFRTPGLKGTLAWEVHHAQLLTGVPKAPQRVRWFADVCLTVG